MFFFMIAIVGVPEPGASGVVAVIGYSVFGMRRRRPYENCGTREYSPAMCVLIVCVDRLGLDKINR